MKPKALFKTGFWLQIALLPFVWVLHIFLGMAAIASWDSGSISDALETTLGVGAFFAATIAVLAAPGHAARIASSRQGRMRKERVLTSFGSGLALLLSGFGAISSFSAGYVFYGLLWALLFLFHASILWYVNRRRYG